MRDQKKIMIKPSVGMGAVMLILKYIANLLVESGE